MKQEVKSFKKLNYVISAPDGYSGGKMPVILYVHGAGGRGTDIEIIKTNSAFNAIEQTNGERFIVVAPQCYADTWFEIFNELIEFAEMIAKEPYADEKRIYLGGASMGGYSSWQLAMSRPELFAAVVPVCGGGMYWNAARLKTVPIWAHHGLLDPCVLPEESVKMVNAVNRCGGSAKISLYENVEHASWINAFENKELYEWLLSKEK